MHARRVREGDQVHLYHVVAPGQYAVLSSDMGVGEVIENEDETARRIVSLTSVQAVLVSQSMQAPAEFGITFSLLYHITWRPPCHSFHRPHHLSIGMVSVPVLHYSQEHATQYLTSTYVPKLVQKKVASVISGQIIFRLPVLYACQPAN